MLEYDPSYAITLVTVVFCALTFTVLAVSLWRERRLRFKSVLAAFTVVCTAAFLTSLLLTVAPGWALPISAARALVTGMIPALLLHLVSQGRSSRLRTAFYAFSAVLALALALEDAELVSLPFADVAPAILLGTASALGLVLVSAPGRSQRMWYRILLTMTIGASAASLISRSPMTELASDYLLLGFFCISLYYQERLIFFDLLLKRAVFFCLALVTLTALCVWQGAPDPLGFALLLVPLWMLAAFTDAGLGKIIDRVFLGRLYGPVDAEHLFLSEMQAASSEEDLRSRSTRCLSAIFQGTAEVSFAEGKPAQAGNLRAMVADLPQVGWVAIGPRQSGISYMSDDRRLFQSLAETLKVMLQNVRFREVQRCQQQREEQLRTLASRAELKALRAQINPHFLFNALNAIAGLIPSQPELADQTVERLAQVFRYTLRNSESEWVRLEQEVEFVTAYLEVEQAKFGERLAIEVSVHPDAAHVPLPAMCIQPLIENALKHGVSSVVQRGEVRLLCTVQGEMLNIEVWDNGPGFPRGFTLAASPGYALANIAERLRGYYGETAQLSWNSEENLTRVRLRIPCRAAALTVEERPT